MPFTPALPSRLRRGYIPRSHFMQEVVMPTEGRPKPHAKNFGENIESDLALEFLRVVENAAIESARTMGQGDRPLSDQVATESMRKTMDTVPMHGTIVIGEGERDAATMLYIGEQLGGPYLDGRSEEHTSELQSLRHLVCRL